MTKYETKIYRTGFPPSATLASSAKTRRNWASESIRRRRHERFREREKTVLFLWQPRPQRLGDPWFTG